MVQDKDLERLKGYLKQAWCRETSYYKNEWTPDNPSCGQCKITSMLVQERFGGTVAFADAYLPDGTQADGGHFFNEIDGRRIDLTADQFPEGTAIEKRRTVSRRFLHRDEGTASRFSLLKQRLASLEP